jgi:hypothetical protein
MVGIVDYDTVIPMDGVFEFGPFLRPIYRATTGTNTRYPGGDWCCKEGHKTPDEAADHAAERMKAAWD